VLAGQAGCHSNVRERTIDQVAHPDQAAIEHGTGGAGKAHSSRSEGGKRKTRDAQQVSQLVGKGPEPLVEIVRVLVRDHQVAPIGELGDGLRNGVCRGSD
jgi:hypothetical protein